MIPQAYVIGAPKAGTTSIAGWLAEHPDVFFSTPKEPFYWASDFPGLRAHYAFDTRARYEALFDHDEARAARLCAEGSTFDLYSRTAVPDILTAAPEARFVICLRRPADLITSYHRTQVVALNEEEEDLATAWGLRRAGSTRSSSPLDPKIVDYPLIGRLGAAVQRLLEAVPRERVHVVWFEELTSDPGATWCALTEFLDLPSAERSEFEARNPSTNQARSRVLRRLTHRPPRALERPVAALRQWSRTTDVAAVRRLKAATWREAPKPALSPELRAELTAYFADDVRLLGDLLGRDLTAWQRVQPDPAD